MVDPTRRALVGRLSDATAVVEVGVGNRPGVASDLAARGVAVTATDIRPCETPPGVAFVRDDITDPTLSVYRGVDAVYARNLPPELHRPTADVASGVDALLVFTTLGTDQPAIPVERETVPGGTLYTVE